MKLLYDFLPIALFFAAYSIGGVFLATAVAIVAAIALLTVTWFRHRRIQRLHLASVALIAVFGGATLLLHDKSFIMWKTTLVYLLFAAVFATGQYVGESPLVQRMLGSQLQLPTAIWRRVGWLWVAFFIACGAINVGFVEYYTAAENRLRATAPAVPEAAYQDLQCDVDFSGPAHGACMEAAARESLWVDFKLFGLLGLTILFILGQTFWLARYAEEPRSGTVPGGT